MSSTPDYATHRAYWACQPDGSECSRCGEEHNEFWDREDCGMVENDECVCRECNQPITVAQAKARAFQCQACIDSVDDSVGAAQEGPPA